MTPLRQLLERSPAYARVVPYVIILALTFAQDWFGEPARYWLYLFKMLVGLWCIVEMRSLVPEMRWAFSWEAVFVGVLICAVWVGLDPYYPKFSSSGSPWNPCKQFGQGSALGLFFVAVRTLGSAIIVPPLEESFYRSFLYRYMVRVKFTEMPLNELNWLSLIVTSAIFGVAHYQWLGGLLCGLAFQWLVLRKNRLGDAMTAHAITNFLLGIWIYWQGAWKFW
jgi:CAAX prenyl protease-like protein